MPSPAEVHRCFSVSAIPENTTSLKPEMENHHQGCRHLMCKSRLIHLVRNVKAVPLFHSLVRICAAAHCFLRFPEGWLSLSNPKSGLSFFHVFGGHVGNMGIYYKPAGYFINKKGRPCLHYKQKVRRVLSGTIKTYLTCLTDHLMPGRWINQIQSG